MLLRLLFAAACPVVQNTFPDLMQYTKIQVVEMMDHVLATYNPRAGAYTEKLWRREGEFWHHHPVQVQDPQHGWHRYY